MYCWNVWCILISSPLWLFIFMVKSCCHLSISIKQSQCSTKSWVMYNGNIFLIWKIHLELVCCNVTSLNDSKEVYTFILFMTFLKVFPDGSAAIESTWYADVDLIPGLGRSPWRRNCKPLPVLLPEKSHGQKSLVDCSPWGHKESDITEHTATSLNAFWRVSVTKNISFII